jgi:hypothetical protein
MPGARSDSREVENDAVTNPAHTFRRCRRIPRSFTRSIVVAGAMLQVHDRFAPPRFSGEFLQYAIVVFVLAVLSLLL